MSVLTGHDDGRRAGVRDAVPARVLGALLLALLATATGGCGDDDEPAHPAAETVESVLQVRLARSTEAADYEPYFDDASVAEALAEAARSEDSDTPAIPEWEAPYLSAETSATADVVVVWVPSDELPDWPAATVFSLRVDERWFIVDAADITTGAIPPELVLEDE
jgi:hypothetical protein